MSWNGYFRYGETEIINTSRVEAYVEALGLAWVKSTGASTGLPGMLGDGEYIHPELDAAPWYDPDIPASADFAGVIPLEVSGIEDSTRSSSVFEFTTDGGNPGTLRHQTKPVVFSVALVGVNEIAVEYGFRWLKRALMRRQCAPGATTSCRGEDLYYARAKPSETGPMPGVLMYDGGTPSSPGVGLIDGGTPSDYGSLMIDGGGPYAGPLVAGSPSAEWVAEYELHLRDVLVNRGPIVNSKRDLPGCNGAVWLVSFTAVAGDPFEYGNPVAVLDDLGDGTDPFLSPYTGAWGSTTYTAGGCATPVYAPIYDPTFPALITPPAPPNIAPAGFVVPSGTWERRYADLPADVIPLWDEVRPVITVHATTDDVRMLRVRFYPEWAEPDDDCDAVGEYIISYLPADADMVIDTAQEIVYIDYGTVVRRADSLVYGSSDAKPIHWFGLSCGDGYRVTLDWDADTEPDVRLDLSLVPRSA